MRERSCSAIGMEPLQCGMTGVGGASEHTPQVEADAWAQRGEEEPSSLSLSPPPPPASAKGNSRSGRSPTRRRANDFALDHATGRGREGWWSTLPQAGCFFFNLLCYHLAK